MEFCQECSITVLGKDFHDFTGLISLEQEQKGYGAKVHCSKCGDIYVNSKGKRLSSIDETIETEVFRTTLHETLDLRQKK